LEMFFDRSATLVGLCWRYEPKRFIAVGGTNPPR
jgi:hypothetical protein